jgi:hypothetical protein
MMFRLIPILLLVNAERKIICIENQYLYNFFDGFIYDLLPSEIIIGKDECFSTLQTGKIDHVIFMQNSMNWNQPNLVKSISLYNTEQLSRIDWYNQVLSDYYRLKTLCLNVNILEYSEYHCSIWRKVNINCEVQQLGISEHTLFQLTSLIRDEPKIYDYVLCGSPSHKRTQIVNSLRSNGHTVLYITNQWGLERDRLIAQGKILLNIHYNNDYQVYEKIRCNRWLIAGMSVLTENGFDTPLHPNLTIKSFDEILNLKKLDSTNTQILF